MAKLDDKGKFRQKWRVCQKFIKGLAKYSIEMTKVINLARSYQWIDKIFLKVDKRDDKKGHLDKWRL